MVRSSFPRRQQHRRLRRAAGSGATAIAAGALAIITADARAPALAGALLLLMIGLVLDTRRWLAGRSRVGARSEDAVREALAAFEAEGWRLCHSLPYGRRGDIDSVAIAPTGIAFAIGPRPGHSTRPTSPTPREMAAWLRRHRRRWCRVGALPILCLVGARGLERVDDDVLVVSNDRLLPALRVRAGTSARPRFLAAGESRRRSLS